MSHLLMGGHGGGDTHGHRGGISSRRGSHMESGTHSHPMPTASSFSKRKAKKAANSRLKSSNIDDDAKSLSSESDEENNTHNLSHRKHEGDQKIDHSRLHTASHS